MRILLIEDEKAIADFLESHLKAESFVVDVASDGERGAYLGRTNDYCLILLDVVLPKKSGLAVLQEIRLHGNMTPVVVLSVTSDAETKVAFLNAGADDYLVKPSSFLELMARIRAILRRPLEIKNNILTVDSLVLDPNKHLVTRCGKEIRLTQKEFMLLAYLMQHRGSAVSRSMILDHVWDLNVDPFSNTIESHIFSLRKKIDVEGEKKLIETVSKIGYRMG